MTKKKLRYVKAKQAAKADNAVEAFCGQKSKKTLPSLYIKESGKV